MAKPYAYEWRRWTFRRENVSVHTCIGMLVREWYAYGVDGTHIGWMVCWPEVVLLRVWGLQICVICCTLLPCFGFPLLDDYWCCYFDITCWYVSVICASIYVCYLLVCCWWTWYSVHVLNRCFIGVVVWIDVVGYEYIMNDVSFCCCWPCLVRKHVSMFW